MKNVVKILTVTLFGFLLNGCICMQDPRPAICDAVYSPVVGVNRSNFKEKGTNSSIGEPESKTGFQAGVKATVRVDGPLLVEAGTVLSTKGSKSSYEEEGYGPDYPGYKLEDKTNMTYLDVPLGARYEVGLSGFSVYAGVQPSLLLSAKRERTGNNTDDSRDVRDDFKALDFAGSVGVGYQFQKGLLEGATLDLGYDHGFANIRADNDDYSEGETYTRTFRFGIGYVLGRK